MMAAYQQAIDSGNPNIVPMAAFGLGDLLEKLGDIEAAQAAYQQVIDSGDAAMAPMAAVGLGRLLVRQGDIEGAKAAYQEAIESGHAEAADSAMRGLGKLQKSGQSESYRGVRRLRLMRGRRGHRRTIS